MTTPSSLPERLTHSALVDVADKDGTPTRTNLHPSRVSIYTDGRRGKTATIVIGNPRGEYSPGYFPTDTDEWTESDIGNWGPDGSSDTVTASTDSDYRIYSVRITPASGHEVAGTRYPSAASGLSLHSMDGFNIATRPIIRVRMKASATMTGVYMIIYDTAGNYVQWNFNSGNNREVTTSWQQYEISRTATINATSGTLDWTDLDKITFKGDAADVDTVLYIDQLYFESGINPGDIIKVKMGEEGAETEQFFGEVRTCRHDAGSGDLTVEAIDMLARLRDQHLQTVVYDTYLDREKERITRYVLITCDTDANSDTFRYPSGNPNDGGAGKFVTAQSTYRRVGPNGWQVADPGDIGTDTGFYRDFTVGLDISDYRELWWWDGCSSTSKTYRLELEDTSGNTAYWNATTSATANTWSLQRVTIRNPDGHSASWTDTSLTNVRYLKIYNLDTTLTYYFDEFGSEPIMHSGVVNDITPTRIEICQPNGVHDASTNVTVTGAIYTGNYEYAERFAAGSGVLDSIAMPLRYSGTPTAPLNIKIYSDDTTTSAPDETDLLAAMQVYTSDIDASAWTEVTPETPIQLRAGTYYWILLQCGGGDASNYYTTEITASHTASPAGVCLRRTGAGAWGTQTYDLLLQLHDGTDYYIAEEDDYTVHGVFPHFNGPTEYIPPLDTDSGSRHFEEHRLSAFVGTISLADIMTEYTNRYAYIHSTDITGATDISVPALAFDGNALQILDDLCQAYGWQARTESETTTGAKLYLSDRAVGTSVLTIVDGWDWWQSSPISGRGATVGMILHDLQRTIEGASTVAELQGNSHNLAVPDKTAYDEYGGRESGYMNAQSLVSTTQLLATGATIASEHAPLMYEGSVTIRGRTDLDVGDTVTIYCSQAGLTGEDMVIRGIMQEMSDDGWITRLQVGSRAHALSEMMEAQTSGLATVQANYAPTFDAVQKSYAIYLQDGSGATATEDQLWAVLGTGGTDVSTSIQAQCTDGVLTVSTAHEDHTTFQRYVFRFGPGNGTGDINEIQLYASQNGSGSRGYASMYPVSLPKFAYSELVVTIDV